MVGTRTSQHLHCAQHDYRRKQIPNNSKMCDPRLMFCYLDATQHSDVGEECGRCKK